MRLLDVSDLSDIRLTDHTGEIAVQYTILSHCWSHLPDGTTDEVDFRSFCARDYDTASTGWRKILKCCELTNLAGYRYTWIDTCCIDKTSSAELSESINSMYAWYRDSTVCYVFLDNCHILHLPNLDIIDDEGRWKQGMGASEIQDVEDFTGDRWFRRGWTLQELLAPKTMLIYTSDHVCLGTKASLGACLSHASGIPKHFLDGVEHIQDASVAQRMCWAANRTTHRIEDVAYSLLGIFDVNMPLLYGEGSKAFLRLQEEIISRNEDQSILAWGLDQEHTAVSGILADHPGAFKNCGIIVNKTNSWDRGLFGWADRRPSPWNVTSRGLSLRFHAVFPPFYGKDSSNHIRSEYKLVLDCCERPTTMQRGWRALVSAHVLKLELCKIDKVWYRSKLTRQTSFTRRWTPSAILGQERVIYASTSSKRAKSSEMTDQTDENNVKQSSLGNDSFGPFISTVTLAVLAILAFAASLAPYGTVYTMVVVLLMWSLPVGSLGRLTAIVLSLIQWHLGRHLHFGLSGPPIWLSIALSLSMLWYLYCFVGFLP